MRFKPVSFAICLFVFQILLGFSLLAQDNTVAPIAPGAAEAGSPQSELNRADSRLLKISVGDLLDVSVFGIPELARVARVNTAGEISLPLVGGILVADLTVEAAQEKIADEFEKQNYLHGPQVSVFIKEYATQGISVLGEVAKPGMYPLFGPVRLLDAISVAGGLTQRAGKRVTITHRKNPAEPVTVLLDGSTEAASVDLIPGDTVQVTKAGVVYVVGNVEKPGGFLMDNNENLTVLQAIALAQGVNKTASLDKAVLIRTGPAGREEIPIPLKRILSSQSPDMALKSDDIIFVPNSTGKAVARRTMDTLLSTIPGVAIYSTIR